MPNAERQLNTQMREIVTLDGAWLRCKACGPDGKAFWGAFRDDAFVAAKWNKHAEKAHKAAPVAAEPRALPQPRAPRNPAPQRQPDTSDVAVAALAAPGVDKDALLDQAIRDLEIGLAA